MRPALAAAVLALPGLLTLAWALPARAQQQARAAAPVMIDQARIIVNNKVLTAREVASLRDLQAKEIRARLQGADQAEALKNLDQHLDNQLVESLLIESRAEQLGITVPDKEIDQRVDAIVRRDPTISDTYSDEQLRTYVYKDELRTQVLQREVYSQVRVDDAAIQHACALASRDNREVEVGHILIRGHDEASLAKIQRIRQLLTAGADFSKTADLYSEDPSVTINHGQLGFIARGQFVKAFEDQAFAMKPGELSEPVQTQFGYHLIKVFAERNSGKINCDALDDATRNRFYTQVFNDLAAKRLDQFISQMKKKADITIYDR